MLVYAFSYTFLPTRDPSTLFFVPTENNFAPPTLHSLPLTDELGRVRLKHSSSRGSDYINASFIDVSTHLHTLIMHTHSYVHTHMNTIIYTPDQLWCITAQGYKQCRAYIATQYPLPGTVNDLWRMVWEYNCSCIVLLCDISKNDKVQNRNTLGSVCTYSIIIIMPFLTFREVATASGQSSQGVQVWRHLRRCMGN